MPPAETLFVFVFGTLSSVWARMDRLLAIYKKQKKKLLWEVCSASKIWYSLLIDQSILARWKDNIDSRIEFTFISYHVQSPNKIDIFHHLENCKSSNTILWHRSSIFPERAWYLFACFLIKDGTFDTSLFPTLSTFTNSCSSNLSLEDTPVDSLSTLQGDSLLNKKQLFATSLVAELWLWEKL